ncbi:hypothetical protein ACU635_31605 [[Actinomadura] parvosata]|uniref:hypothetical protein n=1 Tax=[Actinomadura] parvosata TaxID=1955412 RepID=UPI00406D3D93
MHTWRAYLAGLAELSPASRKRKRAAIASFTKWAVLHDLLQANLMDRNDTVKVQKTLPRPVAAADVAKVLAVICSRRPRKDLPLDRLSAGSSTPGSGTGEGEVGRRSEGERKRTP